MRVSPLWSWLSSDSNYGYCKLVKAQVASQPADSWGYTVAASVIFMQWDSYVGGQGNSALFSQNPVTYNSRQERLHRLSPGDRIWIVSRCPEDRQYYFVGSLLVAALAQNTSESEKARLYGQYAILADRSQSPDLHKQVPAESLLRAFTFETDQPIKYGANIGQSLQTLRFLSESDERLLSTLLHSVQAAKHAFLIGSAACGPNVMRFLQITS